jgi:hypothetical protein
MARNDDRNQGDRDQNDRDRRPQRPQRGPMNRPGDSPLNDSYVQRLAFRLITDLVGDLSGSAVATPQGKVALRGVLSLLGPQMTRILVTAASAGAQSPAIVGPIANAIGMGEHSFFYIAEALDEAFDGIRATIREEGQGEEMVRKVNQHDADRVVDAVVQKHKGRIPPPPKSYVEIFMALLPEERAAWDQILAAFTPEQKTTFALYRSQLSNVEMMRASLKIAVDQSATVVDPQARLARRAKVLLEFLERHFETKKPATAKMGAFVGDLTKKAKVSLEQTFKVLPPDQRNARHQTEMAKIATRRNSYK